MFTVCADGAFAITDSVVSVDNGASDAVKYDPGVTYDASTSIVILRIQVNSTLIHGVFCIQVNSTRYVLYTSK